jgi:putative oxidoreductase
MMNIINCKCSEKWAGFAPLILRVVVGVAFMLHGWQKVQMGNAGIAGFFDSLGIPAASVFAFIITYLEFLGGIALILGVLTHLVSKLLLVDMIVATLLVHLKNGFLGEGGFELTLLLAAACFSLMITGPGKWALKFKKSAAPTQTV